MSKLKELQRRSTIAWSVSSGRPDLIAAGTMAGTVGLDFDTSAQLEVFSLDLDDSSPSLSLVGKTTSSNMFHKIVWGQSANGKYGILAGGMDNGTITIWDPAKISTEGSQDGCIGSAQKHKGPVQALDFNPFQQNLLASGSTDSEIFIWDLGKPADPTVYTPGAKPQQASDIASVAWNKKVQHILASTQFSGVTVIWDLKAKKPVINFADRNSKARAKSIAWHPLEATQILTASEEDDAPVLQMWDLRNVFTPVRTFSGHTRGVWGVSWSPFDPSLVLSCGKDNRTLCWHVDTAEVLCEVESGADPSIWNFDVQWSPRIPAILSTCSLEGKVSIYALQDVCERTVVPSSESFGGAQMQATPARAAPKHTPGWMQRPCGVAFGFGGKLVSFNKDAKAPRTITVGSVVTEKSIIQRSERLEEVISGGNFTGFCDEKISAAATEEEKSTWSFLRVLFDTDARHKILNYLGFDEATTQQEIKDFISSLPADKLSEVAAAAVEEEPKTPSPPPVARTPTPPPVEESATTDESNEPTEGNDSKDVSGLFGSGGEEFSFEQQQQQQQQQQQEQEDNERIDHPQEEEPVKPVAPTKKAYSGPPTEIPTGESGPESAITKALLIGNFEAAVQCCLRLDRVADALILAASGGPELWARTQEAYFARQKHSYARVMSAVVRNDLKELVEHSVLRDWKATLATLCTYTKSSDFPSLSSTLGDRLDLAGDTKAAILCYICAGSIDKAVSIWVRSSNSQKSAHLVLQDLVEKIAIFRQAVGVRDDLNDLLASKYSEYAEILASQGRVQAALRYLSFLNDPKYSNTSGAVLLDRVYHSSQEVKGIQEPLFPFQRVQVLAQGQQPIQSHPTAFTPVAPSNTTYPTTSHSTPSYPTSTPPYSSSTTTYPSSTTAYPPSSTAYPPSTTSYPSSTSTPSYPSATSYPSPTTYPPATGGYTPHAPTHGGSLASSTTPPSYPSSVPPPPTVFTPSAPTTTTSASSPSVFHPTPIPYTPVPPPASSSPVPPPAVFTPTAPSTTVPPPASTPPPSALPPTTAPTRSSAPPAQTPSGDVGFVINAISAQIDAVNAASARNPAIKAKADDMTKRLRQLIDKLKTTGVNAASLDSLTKLLTALNANDHASAQAVLVQLSTGTNDVGASGIIGLKHLIALTKP